MPGMPSQPPKPIAAKPRDPEPLPRASAELLALLQRLTVDVERLAASRGRNGPVPRPHAAPNYHFHFMAKTLMEDGEGQPFPDPESALRHARALATQFAQSGLLYGCTILVARNDEVLFEVPLSRSMN